MECITVSMEKGIAAIALNRPEKRNAMNGYMIQELRQALRAAAADDTVRVVMINGNGDHFCAGADIGWMQTIATESYAKNYDDAQNLADLMYQLYAFPKPTMVLAHGATMGGGLGLLAACDIALAANNASFGFSEVKLGIAPSVISPYVISAIGQRAARYYFLTGERFTADEAKRLQLVHTITEPHDLLSAGLSLAHTLLQNGPHALIAAKQLIRRVSQENLDEELGQKTAEHLARLRSSAEGQEGLRAFVEKRPPAWAK